MASLRRFVAWLALAAFIATQGVALIDARHVAATDDTACLGGVVGTDHQNGPQVEDVKPTKHPLDHCPICHLQRTLNNADPGSASSAALPPPAAAVSAEPAPALTAGVPNGFSPRGPPASL